MNPQSRLPEKASLPTAREVVRAYPLRQSQKRLPGVSVDGKSAHKDSLGHQNDCLEALGFGVGGWGAVVGLRFVA